jgi:hypothetical protein
MVDYLSSKCKALRSNPSTKTKQNKTKQKVTSSVAHTMLNQSDCSKSVCIPLDVLIVPGMLNQRFNVNSLNLQSTQGDRLLASGHA